MWLLGPLKSSHKPVLFWDPSLSHKPICSQQKKFNLLPQNNTDNHKGQGPEDAGGRHDDPGPPEGRLLLNVGRADERRTRVAQRRPVDGLRHGELSVENDGAVVDAARCATDLELVGVDGGQVVHDVLQKNG